MPNLLVFIVSSNFRSLRYNFKIFRLNALYCTAPLIMLLWEFGKVFSIKLVLYCLKFTFLFESLHLEFCSPRYSHLNMAGRIGFTQISGHLIWLWQFWTTNFGWQNDFVMGRIWVSVLYESYNAMSYLSNATKIRSFGPV